MNIPISRQEYAALPYRNDLVGDPVCNAQYRDANYPNDIFIARCANGSSQGKFTAWECYRAEITYAPLPKA